MGVQIGTRLARKGKATRLRGRHPVKLLPYLHRWAAFPIPLNQSMNICINSTDLSPRQKALVEAYLHDNFSFEGKSPTLVWKQDTSGYMLLGYPRRNSVELEVNIMGRDPRSIMFRVHENELIESAGREKLLDFRNAMETWSTGG